MRNGSVSIADSPFAFPVAAPLRERLPDTESLEGPFVSPAAGEAEQLTAAVPRTSAQPAHWQRYATWSDADDRAKGRNPRDRSTATSSGGPANVLVYPAESGRNERIFVLQNFKIDGAALRDDHRRYLADVAQWMRGGARWRVFAEAHASLTGGARHDDALSEDRYLVTRAALESELSRRDVALERVRVAGEGVGFRHTSFAGEDPRGRSVYVVVQPDPSPAPPPAWPPRGAPMSWPPIAPPPAPRAVLDPPRWGPILGPRLSANAVLRTGNAARFLIDGADTFGAMAAAIRTAQSREHYIYLLGWQLVDDFPLIHGDSTSTFASLTASAAGRGVQIRAMLWAKPFDNIAQTRRIDRLPTGAAIRDNETEHPLYGAHHQKVLVVNGRDGLIGFCGGLDVNVDRVAVVGSTVGEPLHDVHARITGPASWDLLQTFIRRWDHHPDHVDIDKRRGPLLGRTQPAPAALVTAASGPESSVPHTCSAIVARTFNPVTRGTTVPRERDIRTLFLAAIGRAERFIYIEDQYLVSLEAAAALRAAVPRLAHLTIVIPGSPATDMPCVWKFRNDFVAALTSGLSPADRAKVRIFQRVSRPITTPPKYGFHTYIHAKTWMFDDELSAIGSANVNRRGWEHDSECDAFIFDDVAPGAAGTPTFAQLQRMALWAEHLGVPAATLADGVASAAAWDPLPPTASVIRYDPTAGRDTLRGIPVPDRVCDGTRDQVDPGSPVDAAAGDVRTA